MVVWNMIIKLVPLEMNMPTFGPYRDIISCQFSNGLTPEVTLPIGQFSMNYRNGNNTRIQLPPNTLYVLQVEEEK